jgi:hypothetical protein
VECAPSPTRFLCSQLANGAAAVQSYYNGSACQDPTNEVSGGALRSQRMETTNGPRILNGALIRVDPVTGGVPASNPTGVYQVAWGLRQPFRNKMFEGKMWVADVGETAVEELNRIEPLASPSMNLGW